jgi:hypothetical protein
LRDQPLSEDGKYLASRAAGHQFVADAKARAGGSFAGVDALEFMNEHTSFNDVAALQASNEAALGFVEACLAEGVAPVIHNQAVANPDPTLIHHLAPSVGAAIAAGGYFAPHCYGPKQLFNAANLYVECYVEQLHQLALAGVDVPPDRVLITEFGHDDLSSYTGDSGAWRKLGLSVTQLQTEYETYAANLRARGIAGAFMYNCFGFPASQGDYELFPGLRDWYGQQLAAHPRAIVPPPIVYVDVDPDTLLNLRSEPRADTATDIGDLKRGFPLVVLKRQDGWLKVRVDFRARDGNAAQGLAIGWVAERWTSPSPPP